MLEPVVVTSTSRDVADQIVSGPSGAPRFLASLDQRLAHLASAAGSRLVAGLVVLSPIVLLLALAVSRSVAERDAPGELRAPTGAGAEAERAA